MVQVISGAVVGVFRWWLSQFTPQGVVGWIFGLSITAVVIPTYLSTRPPAQMISATEDDGIAVIGGEMVVKYHNIRTRFCRNTVTRWLYNDAFEVDGQSSPLWVPLGSSAAPPIGLGEHRYALTLHIPESALPGVYHYLATTDYDCGIFSWLEPPSTRSPDMMVNLVRSGPNAPPSVALPPAAAPVPHVAATAAGSAIAILPHP